MFKLCIKTKIYSIFGHFPLPEEKGGDIRTDRWNNRRTTSDPIRVPFFSFWGRVNPKNRVFVSVTRRRPRRYLNLLNCENDKWSATGSVNIYSFEKSSWKDTRCSFMRNGLYEQRRVPLPTLVQYNEWLCMRAQSEYPKVNLFDAREHLNWNNTISDEPNQY